MDYENPQLEETMKKIFDAIGTIFALPGMIVFGVAAVLYGMALLFPVERPVRVPRILRWFL